MLYGNTLVKSLSGFAECARRKGLVLGTSEVIDGVSACAALAPSSLVELKLKICSAAFFPLQWGVRHC